MSKTNVLTITVPKTAINHLITIEAARKKAALFPDDAYYQHSYSELQCKLADAAIAAGIIQPYEYTLGDQVKEVLDRLNRLELNLAEKVLKPYYYWDGKRSYQEIRSSILNCPSFIFQMNEMCRNIDVHFRESPSGIIIYHNKSGEAIQIDEINESRLKIIIEAAQNIIEAAKLQKEMF